MVKKRENLPRPTRAELNILRVLWRHGQGTVRQVHEAMNAGENKGYTTALKMLQVMHQKGLVDRDDSPRAHIYAAVVTKEETQSVFIHDLKNRLFDGSTSKLVLHALANSRVADQERLLKIHTLISRMQGK